MVTPRPLPPAAARTSTTTGRRRAGRRRGGMSATVGRGSAGASLHSRSLLTSPKVAGVRRDPLAGPWECPEMPTAVRPIMGMPIGIDVRDEGIDVEAAFAWLGEMDATFSTYRDDSEISRLDRGEITLADCRPEVDDVLSRCLALERETRGFFSARPVGRLDPSGLVKGWAIDSAARLLTAAGAERFCINAGGDVVARGRPAPDRRWRVGVRHPVEHDRL